ncbi:hypothetical protein HKX48_007150 [Thoreauomyces humboldtii]|nr:hypothetical protein HKX48_007150 [Thoreauomyces humboldtii]
MLSPLKLVADPNVKKLIQGLTTWVNSYVINDSMTVRDLVADLDDGQLLASFLGQITGDVVVDPAVLAARSDRSKVVILQTVVKYVEGNLKVKQEPGRWSVEGIGAKDISSSLSLLVDLAKVLGCPYPLPAPLSIAVIKREELPSGAKTKTTVFKITQEESKSSAGPELTLGPRDDGMKGPEETDAFDRLFSQPDKVPEVTKVEAFLCSVLNAHSKI